MPKAEGATFTTKVVYGASALAAATVPTTYQQSAAKPIEQPAPQEYGSARGTDNAMAYDERLIDAKLAAVEARTETKFAQLLGKLDLIADKIGDVAKDVSDLKGDVKRVEDKTYNTRVIIITTAIGSVVGIVGLLYALIGYGNMVADSVTGAYATGVSVGQVDGDKSKAGNRAK